MLKKQTVWLLTMLSLVLNCTIPCITYGRAHEKRESVNTINAKTTKTPTTFFVKTPKSD
ncbi:hypothetical protein ACT7CZ_18245 [Bacillus cereus]